MTDAREDLGVVLLDRLPGAAAVAPLSSPQVARDRLLGQGEACRDAFEGDAERLSV